jgi:hypothetical protein
MSNGAGRAGEVTAREREMRRVVAAGEREGLTVREAAWRAGMPAGTLAWWRTEIRRRDEARAEREDKPVFIEVVAGDERLAAPSAPTAAGGDAADARPPDVGGNGDGDAPQVFEVELRGGRRLRVATGYGLARLVREIEGC